MLTNLIDRIKEVSLSELSSVSGIHYNQLWRLQTGIDTNPQMKTINRINKALETMEDNDSESE